jgi:PAS domain S-box-containing protein
MLKVTARTLPWAILLAVVFAAVVLYFAAMIEVTGRISKERDDLEKLSRRWLETRLAAAEEAGAGFPSDKTSALVTDFQRQLNGILGLPWLAVLNKAYPQPRISTHALEAAIAGLVTQMRGGTLSGTAFKVGAAGIGTDMDSLVDWIGAYSGEQMRAFRVLLVFFAAAMMLGAILLLGLGNLIRIQEARFLAAIDSMSDALMLTDAANTVIHANPAAGRLFGTGVGGLEGRPPPDALVKGTIAAGPRGRPGEPFPQDDGIEASLTDSAGRRRPVSLKVEEVRDSSGKQRGSVYLIRDLTEWRRLVASIASTFVSLQVEETENAVAKALDQAASLCGAEIRALLLFGTAEDQGALHTETPGISAPGSLPPGLERWVRRVAESGAPLYRDRESARGADAEMLDGESLGWAAAVPLWFAGTVAGAIALASRSAGVPWGEREMMMPRILGSLVIELLAKKWAMREMNRLGFEYQDLVEHANVPIWGVDSTGRVNEWNRAIAALTGREKGGVLGSSASAMIEPAEGRVDFDSLLEKVLAGGRITDRELRILTEAPGSTTLLVSGAPRLDSEGRVSGAIFIGQDISARVRAERRIREQADALVEVQEIERLRISRDLHDNVAQDLSAARIACETLFDGFDGNADQLRARASQLSRAIASSLSSIRTIAYDLRPHDIESHGLVSSLERLCQSFGSVHSLEVAFQSAGVDGIPVSPEHAVNIYRIVQEALANADRHARARTVNVALVHSHPDLILRITDDGVGFDVARTRAQAAERRRMGLLGIEERAAILGAALTITSKSGRGTQIKLTMPFDRKEIPDGTTENHSPGG